jgi:hypothetical protein
MVVINGGDRAPGEHNRYCSAIFLLTFCAARHKWATSVTGARPAGEHSDAEEL